MSDDRPAAQLGDRPGGVTEPERSVTFRDVFAVREFRALYFSLIVNWIGDYLARAAIVVLVYQQSQSVLLSAASFAVSYLPWIAGGPVLAAVAERYPYRRVLIVCDLARAVPIALIALPDVPVPVILVLMFVAMLGAPPTQAARSALIPLLLPRHQVVTGLAVNSSTAQAAQVLGYLAGATLAAGVGARLGLALDALSFLASAAIIAVGVRPRPAASSRDRRRHLLRETGEGYRLVFGTPLLRSIALMVFALTTFTILPEGLAAGWAAVFHDDPRARGFDQGLIMAAGPVGFVIGGLAVGRLVPHSRRNSLVRPFAMLAPLALALTMWAPNAAVVALLVMISGVAQGVLVPTLNGAFVLTLPHGYRARAFGVMQGGMQLSQGLALIVSGALAQQSTIPLVVGWWSLGGLVLMTVLAIRWRSHTANATTVVAETAAAPETGAAPETDAGPPAAVAPPPAPVHDPATPAGTIPPGPGSPVSRPHHGYERAVRPPGPDLTGNAGRPRGPAEMNGAKALPRGTTARSTPGPGRHSAAGRLDG
ncbi:putative MFS family arabinose efflux permease [Couchioplanes caeruleus]|uniref:Putative MFS family arabinose efflux permease n=1 Tax=Couchioplanes caeruleus TaxID=56438 RepID=A0A3N1GHF6_9ACTN|nr:MFS transporter [Couchioplanes caeruleus]ROP29677.1 putative MFS family arabinose efflux permease [Couchioplanes caeruleus]